MSKIKVNELEAKDTNTNVKLTANGTGVLKVKGANGDDGIVKITSSNGTTGVKLKSPPHSAGQSYTLTLPDNNIAQDKFLKVKSITGSGNTAVGQLEYATVAQPDLNNLNASNVTSGTFSSSVLPTSFSASNGAGMQFISRSFVNFTEGASSNITNLNIAFDDDSMYRMLVKKYCNQHSASGPSQIGGAQIYLLNSGLSPLDFQYFMYFGNHHHPSHGNAGGSGLYLNMGEYTEHWSGVFEISTKANNNWVAYQAAAMGDHESGGEGYLAVRHFSNTSARLGGIRFGIYHSYDYIGDGTEVVLYKYNES